MTFVYIQFSRLDYSQSDRSLPSVTAENCERRWRIPAAWNRWQTADRRVPSACHAQSRVRIRRQRRNQLNKSDRQWRTGSVVALMRTLLMSAPAAAYALPRSGTTRRQYTISIFTWSVFNMTISKQRTTLPPPLTVWMSTCSLAYTIRYGIFTSLRSWRDDQPNLAHGTETKNKEKIKIKTE